MSNASTRSRGLSIVSGPGRSCVGGLGKANSFFHYPGSKDGPPIFNGPEISSSSINAEYDLGPNFSLGDGRLLGGKAHKVPNNARCNLIHTPYKTIPFVAAV